MLVRMGRKRHLLPLLVGMQTGAATLENSMEVLQKIKIDLPYDPAMTLLGIYLRDTGVLMHRGTCTPMFIAALLTIVKIWKEPNEWINKMWFIYAMEYYMTMRKNEILSFAMIWMEPECIMFSEIDREI